MLDKYAEWLNAELKAFNFVSAENVTGRESAGVTCGTSTGDRVAVQLSAVLKGSFMSSL